MNRAQKSAVRRMNEFGSSGEPFFFIFDFEMLSPEVIPLREVNPNRILFDYEGFTNAPYTSKYKGRVIFERYPPAYEEYISAFNVVMANLRHGNSYLVNLTMPTRIESSLDLYEIFKHSKARYKLWFLDKFVCFSPEPFVKITEGKISSFPMKGTIDASLPDAEKLIIQNQKETAEHNTIVDLIRNDLSMVASNVRVNSFRYVERLETTAGEILQVSSHISGNLHNNYQSELGDIIFRLLPAGSVTGAPKEKTVEIIKEAENYSRGYYTGVTGIFDGKDLISSVMIRFVEREGDGLIYKSGGGITINSKPEEEFEELVRKVYVPLV
jgi:para-aminobenzoate synthetase component I